MKINDIKLVNFKNIENLTVSLHPHLNILVGNNAQGKTNFLESLYLLSTTRSIKQKDDRILIKHHQEYAKLNCIFEVTKKMSLKLIITEKGKSLFINNNQIKKSTDYLGKLNTILFIPKDLELFDSAPKVRRKLIDIEIGKISNKYLVALTIYNKLIKERNQLLKNNINDYSLYEAIEDKIIEEQVKIITYRKKFITSLNIYLNKYYQLLSSKNDQIIINYNCVVEDHEKIKEILKFKYKKTFEQDRVLKATTIGIHREDILFKINNNLVSEVASQGQKRMLILALKIGLVEYINEIKGDSPILLLDDVMSELDIYNQQKLLNIIPKYAQTIITTTHINNNIKINDYKLIEIKEGKIVR